jgi:hypothetical protein
MKEADRIEILKTQCIEYAKEFGCLEITHISGSPFYTCELNGVSTALYPVMLTYAEINEIVAENFELWVSQYKNSHKIIRIEIIVDEDFNIAQTRAVTIYDLLK